MNAIDVSTLILSAQNDVETELLLLEKAGLKWYPQDSRDYCPWRVLLTEEGTSIIGPQTWHASAHVKLQVEATQYKLKTIMDTIKPALKSMGGYLETDIPIGFERRTTGMVFYFMNFALKGCLEGEDPKKWTLPKVLNRIQPIPTGNGIFKMGSHTFLADSPDTVIKLYLILSAPKTDPKTRKKPKDMATIQQVWDFENVRERQKAVLENWKNA